MNGELLPLEHGFPARLIVPGLYGSVSATKWLTEIEPTTFAEFDAYWAQRDWSVEAPRPRRNGPADSRPPAMNWPPRVSSTSPSSTTKFLLPWMNW